MAFAVLPSRLEGPLYLQPDVFRDDRGFFTETFRHDALAELGVTEPMIQHNHSRSVRGTVRGMHYQIGEGCSKLVRCGRGTIVDVLVDVRRGSPTYGEWEAYELSDETGRLLYAPVGFAHGFCVMSDVADVFYLQSKYYTADVERGFALDDPDVAIAWPLAGDEMVVSERDRTAPTLAEVKDELPFVYAEAAARG